MTPGFWSTKEAQPRGVAPSEWLWKKGAGYYTEEAELLLRQPVLPDTRRLLDQRMFELFRRHGRLNAKSEALEVGCGRSHWLAYLALRFGCSVAGIDLEPYAAELATANLTGAGVVGHIIMCRDAFDLTVNQDLLGRFDLVYSMGLIEHFDDASDRLAALRRYLKPGGRILTTVPNLQAVNWALQRLGDLKTLQAHVIYDRARLAEVHEKARFRTLGSGYVGFYDGFVTSAAGVSPLRRRIHHRLCWMTNLGAEAWKRLTNGKWSPELSWLAPHVFYAGERG